MVEERAVVVAVDGLQAWVEAGSKAGCGSCSAASSCGTAALGKLFGNRPFRIAVSNPLHAAVGEEVTIAIPERGLMSGAARLYLLPVLLLFAVLLTVEWVLPSKAEWPVVVLSLLLSWGGVRWMSKAGWFETSGVVPEIVRVHTQHIQLK